MRGEIPIRATAGALLAAAALITGGCGNGPSSSSSDTRLDEVEQAFRAAGLEVCSSNASNSIPPDARSEQNVVVAQGCPAERDDSAQVQVTTWENDDARDAAAARLESHARPSSIGYGAVWTLGPLTIDVSGARDSDVSERIADALDELGAGD